MKSIEVNKYDFKTHYKALVFIRSNHVQSVSNE